MFVHLHTHTDYSLLDGLNKIKEYVKKVKSLGQTAAAITDHGTAAGLVDFYNACKAEGIRPVLGCEFYLAFGGRKEKGNYLGKKYSHLILLVKNEAGYKNLCLLVTRSNTEGFYGRPRIDKELLEKHHEGLICLSGCVAGSVAQYVLHGDMAQAKEEALWFRGLFGKDYYLEIQNHGLEDETTAFNGVRSIARELGVKLVATNDVHYTEASDKEAHQWLVCMQTGKTINSKDKMEYVGDYSVKSEEEMLALFPTDREAVLNTQEVADKCNFEFEFADGAEDYRMPRVVIPEKYGEDYFGYLSDEAWNGLERRYPIPHENREQARENLEYELSIIEKMGFAEYFLDTRKTILWARSQGILVGPGRGSGAGSTLNYCLGITDLDPVRYGLIFERFLNPSRISMPDIDVDYQFDRKDDVIASEAESNGTDKFCKIMTFNTMAAKGVLRDCVRVAGLPVSVGNDLSKFIPKDASLMEAWEMNGELRDYVGNDSQIKKVWDIALILEGTKTSASTHACGHIPTPQPCEELFPCSVDSKTGYLVCQYDMVQAEHLGNLKKDLLMLRNLTVIKTAHDAIKENYGINVPLWNDEVLDDRKALALISSGDTAGVFQLESEGMKALLRTLKPTCFEDVIAAVSLYRPGPMDFIPAFVAGKHNPSSVTYVTPELEPILASTYGQIVYQEQVMQIVRDLGGFDMARADLVRKAMGKKKMDIMKEEGKNFVYGNETLGIPGCINKGIAKEVAEGIYAQMVDFAKYAFNKSHAACYAAISMQTAYLKAHYPLEFYAGLLTSVMDKPEILGRYATECKKRGYEILPPDVNTSGAVFSAKDGAIIFGLNSIRSLGSDMVSQIIRERAGGAYKGLTDFCQRTSANSAAVKNLIYGGGFDFTGATRHSLIEGLDSVKKNLKSMKSECVGQMSLFDMFGDSFREECYEPLEEYPEKDRLLYEKEATGYFISGGLLDNYRTVLSKISPKTSLDFLFTEEGDIGVEHEEPVTLAGVVKAVKKHICKSGDPMAFVTLEDDFGEVSVVVFPKVYASVRHMLKVNETVVIKGIADLSGEGKVNLLANTVTQLERVAAKVWVRVDGDSITPFHKATEISVQFPGQGSVVLVERSSRKKAYLRSQVCPTEQYLNLLKAEFGEENVAVTV